MGHPSSGHDNLVISSFNELLKSVDEIYGIDEEIETLVCKVRNLRATVLKKKGDFVKGVNRCKKNYNVTLYEGVMRSASKYISTINSCYFFKSPTLTFLNKKLNSSECQRKASKTSTNKRPIASPKLSKECLDTVKRSRNEATSEENDGSDFPVWNNKSPGKIRIFSRGFTNERVSDVYVPPYSPNPFSDFMLLTK